MMLPIPPAIQFSLSHAHPFKQTGKTVIMLTRIYIFIYIYTYTRSILQDGVRFHIIPNYIHKYIYLYTHTYIYIYIFTHIYKMHTRVWSIALCVCVASYMCASGFFGLDGVAIIHEKKYTSGQCQENKKRNTAVEEKWNETQPVYDRLVLVMIDALRADMVMGSEALHEERRVDVTELNSFMPYTKKLFNSNKSISYVAHAGVPTGIASYTTSSNE